MQSVQHISIYIDRNPTDVYDFTSNPKNLPLWAAGLTSSELKKEGDSWLAEAPFGQVKIRFAERNTFGVMDHDVEFDSGLISHNPMRVMPNGLGSEVVFSLFKRPDMSDDDFTRDQQAVEKDLARLKSLLESV